ncbi:oleate hydratase [Chloroflexota bacterium]
MDKSIIIIGAGIAGLSAGCYSQMNGYRTRIFEMHTLPGGLCTSWKRKGYTIDAGIRFTSGCSSTGCEDIDIFRIRLVIYVSQPV